MKNGAAFGAGQRRRYDAAAEVKPKLQGVGIGDFYTGKKKKQINDFERKRVLTTGPQIHSKKKPKRYGRTWVDKVPAPPDVDGDSESDDLTFTQKYRGKVLEITESDYPVLHCTDLKSMSPEKQAEMQRLYGSGSASEKKRKAKIRTTHSQNVNTVPSTLLPDWDD